MGIFLLPQVSALVEHLLDEERRGKHLKMAVIFLVVFTVILLGAMTGLTYTVVTTLKDTKVNNPNASFHLHRNAQLQLPIFLTRIYIPYLTQLQDNAPVLISKAGDVIQVAHVNMIVTDRIIVQRPSAVTNLANSGWRLLGASASSGTENVLRVSAFTGVQQPLTSAMDIDSLIELNFLHVSCMIRKDLSAGLFLNRAV